MTLACVRMIIGDKGNVLWVRNETLYCPEYMLDEFLEQELLNGSIENIEKDIDDAEVLVVFHPISRQSNHPLDPIEWDTELEIDHVIVLQSNYKEFWREQVTNMMEVMAGAPELDADTKDEISTWEEVYDEDFTPSREIKPPEPDPYDVFPDSWHRNLL